MSYFYGSVWSIYFEDKDGNIHQATCKTSALSGVYFTEDIITTHAKQAGVVDNETELEIENRKLKQEIEELKRNRGI